MGFDILLEQIMTGIFGSMNLASIMIIFFFLIVFIILGLNVRMGIIATAPLGVTFALVGWLDSWVGGLYWVFIIGFGLYTVWNLIAEQSY